MDELKKQYLEYAKNVMLDNESGISKTSPMIFEEWLLSK